MEAIDIIVVSSRLSTTNNSKDRTSSNLTECSCYRMSPSRLVSEPEGLNTKKELEKNCSELIKELNLLNKNKKEVQKTIMSFCENYEKLCQKKL